MKACGVFWRLRPAELHRRPVHYQRIQLIFPMTSKKKKRQSNRLPLIGNRGDGERMLKSSQRKPAILLPSPASTSRTGKKNYDLIISHLHNIPHWSICSSSSSFFWYFIFFLNNFTVINENYQHACSLTQRTQPGTDHRRQRTQ